MKFIKNNLAVLALIAGTLGAFAFNNPDPEPVLFGKKADGSWERVTPGQYICDINPQEICTAVLDENGKPISSTVTHGEYQPM